MQEQQQKKRQQTVVFLGLFVLVVVIVMLFLSKLTSREPTVSSPVIIVTATSINVITATPFVVKQSPTATPVAGIEGFPEIAGYGYWTTLKRVGDDVEVEKLKPSISSSCAIRVKGPRETLITNTQCTATDDKGNTFVIPWPGWVDSCKIVRFVTPAITEPITLTVNVSNQAVMYVMPGKNERVECVIGDKGYQAGDVFPVPGGVSYIIDLSSEDGKSGWIVGSNSFYPTDVFGWVRVHKDGTFGEYKEFRRDKMGGGWWVWGNTLYITMSDFSHICVDLASDSPEGDRCNP